MFLKVDLQNFLHFFGKWLFCGAIAGYLPAIFAQVSLSVTVLLNTKRLGVES